MTESKPELAAHRARRGGAATIYDVARLSGVSPSTVSRALNKPGRISAKTESRIREVAAAMGYQLNPMARALPTGRTHTLALMLSDITNPVFFDVIRGAERVAASLGYTLVLAESQESADREAETAQRLLNSVDGLILVSSRLETDMIRTLEQRRPVMLVNRKVPGVPSAVPDVRPGIVAALDELVRLGHRSLAFVPGPTSSWMSGLRERTVAREAAARDIAVRVVGTREPTVTGGEASFDAVQRSGVTAVLAFNDLMAIGLLRACRSANVRVPQDLSLIGFDDIFGSDFTSPAITTIRSPLGDAGEEAARRLVALIDDGPGARGAPLRTQLVWRDSVGPVRA